MLPYIDELMNSCRSCAAAAGRLAKGLLTVAAWATFAAVLLGAGARLTADIPLQVCNTDCACGYCPADRSDPHRCLCDDATNPPRAR